MNNLPNFDQWLAERADEHMQKRVSDGTEKTPIDPDWYDDGDKHE
jgi:hypothetical protein